MEGMQTILKQSIGLFDQDFIRREVKEVRVDTTVQVLMISKSVPGRIFKSVPPER
jgi:hypothetical protein